MEQDTQSPPIHQTMPKTQGTSFLRIISLLVFALIIATLSSLGTYYFTNKSIPESIQSNTLSTPHPRISPTPEKIITAQSYLAVPEWSVKIPLNKSIEDLYYTKDTKHISIFHFRTKKLDSLAPNCLNNTISIERGLANETYYGETSNSTFEKAYNSIPLFVNLLINNYYFVQAPPGGVCTSDNSDLPIVKSINDALKNIQ